MNELYDGGELDMVLAAIAGRSRRQEHERRAQPLAASGDDVFRDLTDEDHVGFEPAPDHGIDGEHVRGDKVAEKFGLQRGLSHCGIDLAAGDQHSIISLTIPAKGMYNFVFFQSDSEIGMYAVSRTGGKQDPGSSGEKLMIGKPPVHGGNELSLYS